MAIKNKQSAKQAPIVYTLCKDESVSTLISFVISMVELELMKNGSSIFKWTTKLNLFTKQELTLLKIRILNPRNKLVGLNQKHFAIWYAVLVFTNRVFKSDTELNLLEIAENFKSTENHTEGRQLILEFTENYTKEIMKDYKLNHSLEVIIAKINNC